MSALQIKNTSESDSSSSVTNTALFITADMYIVRYFKTMRITFTCIIQLMLFFYFKSGSQMSVTNNSLSEDYPHRTITLEKQLIPLGLNHLPNFLIYCQPLVFHMYWSIL